MEDKSGFQKPLRRAFDKGKDLLNTYKKNEDKVIPIVDADTDKANAEETAAENVRQEEMNQTSEDIKADGNILSDIFNNMFSDNSAETAALVKERDDLKEQLIRKSAEFENQRKRHLKEKQEMLDYANERMLYRMIELLDDINSAVDAGKKSTDYDALLKGLDMIQQKAFKLFSEAGVKKMDDPSGTEFNVHLHEAMMMMPSDKPEGTVLQAMQAGYMMHDKVLRHARVITSSGEINHDNQE